MLLKANKLFGFLCLVLCFSAVNELKAQCSFSGLSPTYCLNSPASTLQASNTNGVFFGNGISNSVFTPLAAGAGTQLISYSYCANSYSQEAGTFTLLAYYPNYITLGDNQMSASLPIGFNFRFFCSDYSNFYISSNGFITFSGGQSDGCCQGLALPSSSAPQNMIACAWTDLDPSQGGTIRYLTIGTAPNRMLIVSFNCVFHKTGNGPVTAEIFLYEGSNVIEINTVTKPIPTGTNVYNTTMGIQNAAANGFAVPGRNGTANWTATNEQIRFVPAPECLVTQSTQVFVSPSLSATSNPTVICKGEQALLTANGALNYTWFNVQNNQSVNVSPPASSVFTVSGTNAFGCEGTATVLVKVLNCVGIAEEEQEPEIKIFPNPCSEQMNLELTYASEVFIYSSQAELVYSEKIKGAGSHIISCKHWSPGLYHLLCIQDEKYITTRFVIQK